MVNEKVPMKRKPPGSATQRAAMEPRYLTLTQAGEYCGGKSAEAMRMMCRRGHLDVIKKGRSTFIDRLDIDRVMQESKLEIPA